MKFSKGYKNYINSREWARKSEFIKKVDDYTCRVCNFRKAEQKTLGLRFDAEYLQVHHLTYVRLYSELITDLTTLCQACHNDITRIKRESKCSLDIALNLVCKKFGKSIEYLKELIKYRSLNINWPSDLQTIKLPSKKRCKRKSTKKNKTHIFAACGLSASGLFYDQKSARKIKMRNKKFKCKKFTKELRARKWIMQKLNGWKNAGLDINPIAFSIVELEKYNAASDNEQQTKAASYQSN